MPREYAAVPHSYLEEMSVLTDEEFGRLMRGLIEYSLTGFEPDLPGRELILWGRCKANEDKAQEYYEAQGKRLHNRAVAAAAARWNAIACESMQENAEECNSMQENANDAEIKRKKIKRNKNTIKSIAHARSEYGWVKLTDEQYLTLSAEIGEEELSRVIRYIDESAQASGNKNHWKDWNLVIRKAVREQWGRPKMAERGKQAIESNDVDPMIKAILAKRREEREVAGG